MASRVRVHLLAGILSMIGRFAPLFEQRHFGRLGLAGSANPGFVTLVQQLLTNIRSSDCLLAD
jgi:hypothetical protein